MQMVLNTTAVWIHLYSFFISVLSDINVCKFHGHFYKRSQYQKTLKTTDVCP